MDVCIDSGSGYYNSTLLYCDPSMTSNGKELSTNGFTAVCSDLQKNSGGNGPLSLTVVEHNRTRTTCVPLCFARSLQTSELGSTVFVITLDTTKFSDGCV